LPGEIERLIPKITNIYNQISEYHASLGKISQRIGLKNAPDAFEEVNNIVEISRVIEEAPVFGEDALNATEWSASLPEINILIKQGLEYQHGYREIEKQVHTGQFGTP
jgi:hypothetical protein